MGRKRPVCRCIRVERGGAVHRERLFGRSGLVCKVSGAGWSV